MDNNGVAITPGVKLDVEWKFGATITSWDILADQVGSIVVDIWSDTYSNFPPTVGKTITGSEKPTLSTAAKNQDTSLTSLRRYMEI
jgi:hypothetical protein